MPHKLLLADDSVTIQRVIELTFADEDVLLTAVGDGKLAIERIEADPPDIVLADVGMPEKDGYEVAAFIKGNPKTAHIPVLLLTGAFEPVDEERARAVGCDGVLAKPFEPQMVITRVKELLAEASRPAAARRGAPPPIAPPPASEVSALSDSLTPAADDATVAPPADAATEPGGSEAVSIESALDAAVRIRRRQTMAMPDYGVLPVEEPPARVEAPEPVTPVPDSQGAIDEYFERLDAAFSSLIQPAAVEPHEPVDLPWALPSRETPAGVGLPEDLFPPSFDLLEPATSPGPAPFDVSAGLGPGPEPEAGGTVALPAFAQAFSAMLAAERGEAPPPAPPDVAARVAPPVDVDDLVARVTRQVLDQMTDRIVRETVTDIVSRTAERLVREEIDRIKATIK